MSDFGTFENERDKVYEELFVNNKASLTLSGHSHRSGLYQVTGTDRAWYGGNPSINVCGAAPDAKTQQWKPEFPDRCHILVSGCGGPIAVQNFDGELHNWGLDYPSGSAVIFNERGIQTIKRVIPQNPTAKPRLSVALDFADIMG
ncbi:MAG: hypothetical protein CUN57_01665, partial [Phototrophicales bacterium]